jgi:NAD(P)-dependent dehydrogenase (short-subunit alcohol dehydrogenase family)
VKTKKKICLVTGGSRGIGRGLALILAKENYKIALSYNNNKELATEVVNKIVNEGGEALAVRIAVEDRVSIQQGLDEIGQAFDSSVSLLVNNAAIAQEKPFLAITDADWLQMLAVNLQGPFAIVQELIPSMIENEWGRIVNITSIGGQWGGLNQVHYAASKAALINFTQSIAKLYSSYGITSNAVSIGLAHTSMSDNEIGSNAGKQKVASIPIGRIAEIPEIAEVVKFLCSSGSSYITGQTINVNGGMYFG